MQTLPCVVVLPHTYKLHERVCALCHTKQGISQKLIVREDTVVTDLLLVSGGSKMI